MEEGDAVGKLRHREDVSGKMPFSISHKSSSFREVGAQPVGGYWESGDGRRTMSSLPSTAPPLDLRQLEWHAHSGSGDASPTNECAATVGGVYPYREHRQREADAESLQQQHQHEQRQGDPDDFAPAEFVSPFASPLTGDPVSVGGVNGKSSFPAGSALQAARSAK